MTNILPAFSELGRKLVLVDPLRFHHPVNIIDHLRFKAIGEEFRIIGKCAYLGDGAPSASSIFIWRGVLLR